MIQEGNLKNKITKNKIKRNLLIEISPAAFRPEGFLEGDCHRFDRIAVPDLLPHWVSEPKEHQVLNDFLSEVVIDAVEVVFVEIVRQGLQ